MNYDRPELIEPLAAEYVLGTLRGKARDRFDRLKRDSNIARAAVWRWEKRFNGMTRALAPSIPPTHIWRNIERQINASMRTTNVVPLRAARMWKTWSALATAASFVLATLLFMQVPQPTSNVDHVAVFSNQQAQPQWLVSFDSHNGKFSARALNIAATQADKTFELWMLPESGAPRSLGLLPTESGVINVQLAGTALASLQHAAGLAVSLEPAGGSPTGLPTGPVLYQAPLLKL
jgi:anti-sigma-K factor RskA